MPLVPPLPKVTELARYVTTRNDTTCAPSLPIEQCDYIINDRWHDWYWADITFGQSTVYLFCATLAFFTLLGFLHRARHTRSGTTAVLSIPGYTRAAAFMRGVVYRQFCVSVRWGYGLTVGQIGLVVGMVVFFSAMTLGPKPYYWPSMDYGYSPPIATRAGFMAIAILPFQVLFASKWSFVTLLTGVSHEKLQVYHRWCAWVMFVLALIHTFPFIVVDIQNGIMETTWRTDWFTVSGVICLIPQMVLTVLSLGFIRDRYYETFKATHYLMAAFFIPTLFVHCGFSLTSAYYFIGLAAVYTASLFIRWIRVLTYGIHYAHIEVLDDRMLRLTIPVIAGAHSYAHLGWKPGQHFFFRFLTGDVHSLTSHPFTVASVPSASSLGAKGGRSELEVYMRSHGGMTARLARLAARGGKAAEVGVGVLLDGPYGGVGGEMRVYDHVLLIAGGSGGSVILSVLRHLVQRGSEPTCQSVTVVYACRSLESATWFRAAFADAATSSVDCAITIFFHVSSLSAIGGLPELSSADDPGQDSTHGEKPSLALPPLHPGRPSLPAHIRECTSRAGTLAVVVCGPKELEYDVRNAVVGEQMKIARGELACRECYLHTESFGW